MRRKRDVTKPVMRYSEAFKMEVVRELEAEGKTYDEMRRKYGIRGGCTVPKWVKRYGNGTRGRVIRVERPEEIDETKRLKERIRQLEAAVADAYVELSLERAYVGIACKRAGITDVVEFKKKADGMLPTKP
jgi:transposase-like protein